MVVNFVKELCMMVLLIERCGKTCKDYVRFSFAALRDNILTHWKISKKCIMSEIALPKMDT